MYADKRNPDDVALYTTPTAAQRQCEWPTCQSEEYQQALAEQIKQELVTGAAQRPWIGLTDEDKLMCWARATHDADVEHKTEHQCLMDYGTEIEAKLKAKNFA
jgi:hypothetical protein